MSVQGIEENIRTGVSKGDPDESENLSLVATPEMCIHAFNVVIHELLQEDRKCNDDSIFLDVIPAHVECPLFITWEKKHVSEKDFRLRGCIGTLAPRQLSAALGDYALTSAFRDHRFNPISTEEVQHLRVGISLLVDYETCNDCFDWHVGIHGILIKFNCPVTQNCFNATFLPEISKQQNWTKTQTVEALIRKSGYEGSITNTFLLDIECTRYKSSKHHMKYDEYVKMVGEDPVGEK